MQDYYQAWWQGHIPAVVRRGPPAYATGPRGCETPKATLTSACVSPPGRGKKARCSSLMTPLSMRCGRMPRRSGWSSSWTCGTPSWPLSRDAAFLQSKRNCHSLGCAPRRLLFCCSWAAELDVQAPWLFRPLALQLKTSKVPSGWEVAGRSICLTAIHLGGPLLQVTHDSTELLPGLKGNTWLCLHC